VSAERLADPAEAFEEQLVTLLRQLELQRRSGQVRVKTELGPGTIWFRHGRVIDAELAGNVGLAAVFRMLGLREGTLEVEDEPVSRRAAIDGSTDDLLEARSRRVTEWRRLLEIVPSLDTIAAIDRRLLDAQRAKLAQSEFALLSLVDRRRTLLELIEASGLDAVGALERIASYFECGLLIVARTTPSTFPRDDDGETR
jgi:hypothetical protein